MNLRNRCKELQNPKRQICKVVHIVDIWWTVSMNLQAFVKHMVHKEPFPIIVESLQMSSANHLDTCHTKSLFTPISIHDKRLYSQIT